MSIIEPIIGTKNKLKIVSRLKAVIQRVTKASVTIASEKVASIHSGLLVLLGIAEEDSKDDIQWLSKKITNLRVFSDANGVMNRSLLQVQGDVIVVSQFTLHAQVKKGNRPSYTRAAHPDRAIPLYEDFIKQLELDLGKPIQTGRFGADMSVELVNNGPVTIIIDTKNRV